MNEMRKLMEAVKSTDLYNEFTEEFVTEPLGDYWDKGYNVASSIEQADNYPAHPLTIKALNDIPSLYMKPGDTLYLEPSNEMGELYSEENGLTYDWDLIFSMYERGQIEMQVGDDGEPEMVPYVEEDNSGSPKCKTCDGKGFLYQFGPECGHCNGTGKAALDEDPGASGWPAEEQVEDMLRDLRQLKKNTAAVYAECALPRTIGRADYGEMMLNELRETLQEIDDIIQKYGDDEV